MKSSFWLSLVGAVALSACSGSNGINGVDGVNGVNGTNASIQTSVLAEGDENCPNGGIKIDILSDGIIQEDQTQYICHGSTGAQGDTGPQGAQGEVGPQGIQGETGAAGADGVCANNIKPEIAVEFEAALVYQAGKAYSLTISANKAGLDYQFVAPLMELVVAEAEIEKDGKYVTQYAVMPEEGAKNGVIIATDGCQTAVSEWNMGAVVGSVEIAGVKIPAGSFNSSVPDAVNPVSVDAFVMAKTETTVEQFKACVDAGACASDNYYTTTNNKYCNYDRGEAWLNHPMNCVNWHGANEYCAWIGGRLPTEDEWQYAATHDGAQALETTYPWGDTEPVPCAHANYLASNQYCDGTTLITRPSGNFSEYYISAEVGTYSPLGDSPLGLQDMSGNVWEWTASRWEDEEDQRVVKGGCYGNSVMNLPVADRDHWVASGELSPHRGLGFRCVNDIFL